MSGEIESLETAGAGAAAGGVEVCAGVLVGALATGAGVVLAGAGYHAVEIDASKKIMVKQIDLLGCRGDPTIAWIKTLRLLETGKLNLKPIISDILPLSEWEEGFRLANSRNSLKVLLQP